MRKSIQSIACFVSTSVLLTWFVTPLFGKAAFATYLDRSQKWVKPAGVRVCFASPAQANLTFASSGTREYLASGAPFTSAEKKAIRDAVVREYTRDRTGIYFRKFSDCTDRTSEYDLMLFKTFGNFTGLGGQTPSRSAKKLAAGKPYIVFEEGKNGPDPKMKFRKLDNWAYLALHEFGHATGFQHEQLLKAAFNDPNCLLLHAPGNRPGVDYGFLEEPYAPEYQLTAYDPDSIMNTCKNRAVEEMGNVKDIHLSPENRRALRKLYR